MNQIFIFDDLRGLDLLVTKSWPDPISYPTNDTGIKNSITRIYFFKLVKKTTTFNNVYINKELKQYRQRI